MKTIDYELCNRGGRISSEHVINKTVTIREDYISE